MKKITAREIALSGITAALTVIAVVLSHYVSVLTLTFLALSSVILTLPMMGGSLRGSVLAYLVAAGLSFLFVGYISLMPFVLMFGLYPIVDYLLRKYLKKRVFVLLAEIAFANASFVACFFAIGLTLEDFPIVNSFPTWAKILCIFGLFTVVFVVFHFAFTTLYDALSERLGKAIKGKSSKGEQGTSKEESKEQDAPAKQQKSEQDGAFDPFDLGSPSGEDKQDK